MSLKRVLGTMLATRFGGRGRNRGSMGAKSMLAEVRRRRHGSIPGNAGPAALGYMAYLAYQHRQWMGERSAFESSGRSPRSLGAKVHQVVDRVSRGHGSGGEGDPEPTDQQFAEDGCAADSMNEDTALLLIRAMIAAAHTDRSLNDHERAHILREIEESGGDRYDRHRLEAEMAHPKPFETLAAQVNDQETAEAFYLAYCSAVDIEMDAKRTYLVELRQRLNLSEGQAHEIENFV